MKKEHETFDNLFDYCEAINSFDILTFISLTQDQIIYLLNKKDKYINWKIARQCKLTKKQFNSLFNESEQNKIELSKNQYLTKSQIFRLIKNNTKGNEIKNYLLVNNSINKDIRQKIINDTIKENVFK